MKHQLPTTWEQVAEYHNIPAELPDSSAYPEDMRNYMNACYQKPFIVDAVNGKDDEGKQWTPDYTDRDQVKYEMWLEVDATKEKPSGAGLSYSGYDDWITVTIVGPRFVFESREKAKHAFDNFKKVFEDSMLRA